MQATQYFPCLFSAFKQLSLSTLPSFTIALVEQFGNMAHYMPELDRLPYEESDPGDLWRRCIEFQERWRKESPSSEKMRRCMDDFKRQRAISLVWMSNKLEGTLPKGATELETHRLLSELLDRQTDISSLNSGSDNDSEDRTSRLQLFRHMGAYNRLCEQGLTECNLSVDLIKETHKILMEELKNDGKPVTAGAYREIPVSAHNHQYPCHRCVPSNMDDIVKEYNRRYSQPNHDPYQLASWLLFQVISLHPFEDGNGRLCRLLWCYSLMRDGLPFPTILTSGHTKAYYHYIRALKKSRRISCKEHSPLTSLTVLSVYQAWNNFFFNWDHFESK